MKKETIYKVSCGVNQKYFSRIVDARKYIEKKYPNVDSCWRDVYYKNKHKCEIIFRNISKNDFAGKWNNKIKAKVKSPVGRLPNKISHYIKFIDKNGDILTMPVYLRRDHTLERNLEGVLKEKDLYTHFRNGLYSRTSYYLDEHNIIEEFDLYNNLNEFIPIDEDE